MGLEKASGVERRMQCMSSTLLSLLSGSSTWRSCWPIDGPYWRAPDRMGVWANAVVTVTESTVGPVMAEVSSPSFQEAGCEDSARRLGACLSCANGCGQLCPPSSLAFAVPTRQEGSNVHFSSESVVHGEHRQNNREASCVTLCGNGQMDSKEMGTERIKNTATTFSARRLETSNLVSCYVECHCCYSTEPMSSQGNSQAACPWYRDSGSSSTLSDKSCTQPPRRLFLE